MIDEPIITNRSSTKLFTFPVVIDTMTFFFKRKNKKTVKNYTYFDPILTLKITTFL